MTEFIKQSMDLFQIREVLYEICDVKFVAVWMALPDLGDGRRVDKCVSDCVAPGFRESKSNNHYAALRDPSRNQFDDRSPMQRFFQARR